MTVVTDMSIITPKGFEEQCLGPIAIMTATSGAVMSLVHVLGMFLIFTKIDKMFNPNRMAAAARQQQFFERLAHPKRKR